MSVPKSSRYLSRRVVVSAVVALVLGGGAYLLWERFRERPDDLGQYQLVKVQRTDLEDLVTATGSLQPRDYVDVGAQVSGQLKKIHVETGSVVQAGDLLAEIDPTVYRANVDARRAQLKNLQASLQDKQSQLLLARQQQARQQGLLRGEATSEEAAQQADAAVRSAQAQIEALQAQIEQSESTLRADEANLNYANIYSPISGVVVSITARQGQTINASQQAPVILRVADLSTMTVQTQVSEADISQLREGMDAYFTTLGNRGRRWWGTLRKVEPTPTVTNNVVLYNALFDVLNDQRNLLPQMTAQVFFVAATAKDALVVPASAVTIERAPREREREGQGDAKRGNLDKPVAAGAASGAASVSVQGAAGKDRAARREGAPMAATSVASAAVAPRTAAPMAASAPQRVGAPEPGRAPAEWAQMGREERRAMMERLSPEEREAMRERMRATRERSGESMGGSQAGARGEGPGAGREREAASATAMGRDTAGSSREPLAKPAARPSTLATPVARTPTTVWAGVGQGRLQRPRTGVVKVVTPEGRIEERKVQVGISNRVQTQILSGLKEGEQVVAGVKTAQNAARGDGNQRNALQGGMGQPGGMPGGMGGGRAR